MPITYDLNTHVYSHTLCDVYVPQLNGRDFERVLVCVEGMNVSQRCVLALRHIQRTDSMSSAGRKALARKPTAQ